MEPLLEELREKTGELLRRENAQQERIEQLESANLLLNHENVNLQRRVDMLESLKRKQKEITTTICTYQKSTEVAKPQSVASSNSKPVDKLAENRTPSKLDVDWDAESTEEYLPFESPTKRSRTVLLDNIIPVNEIPNLSYARTSTVVEKPIAGKLRASGGTDVIARAKHNSLRRETVRNRCWFFQNGQCSYGSNCTKSHDVVPFKYCPEYNKLGVCTLGSCTLLHELYEYEPRRTSKEAKKGKK